MDGNIEWYLQRTLLFDYGALLKVLEIIKLKRTTTLLNNMETTLLDTMETSSLRFRVRLFLVLGSVNLS